MSDVHFEGDTAMTDQRMALLTRLEQAAGSTEPDVLRAALAWAIEELMEADVTERLGAEPHERTPERTGQRNGHRPRLFDTRAGALELAIPKLRSGSYFPDWLLEPRRRAERALVAVIQEAYVKGVSTRKVDDLVRAMGASGVSKSEVSRLVVEARRRPGRLPRAPPRRDHLSVSVARCPVREGARRRPDRECRLPHRHRQQRARRAGGARLHGRPGRIGGVLDAFPSLARGPRPDRRLAGHQ
jgi:putative transposase